VPKRLTRREEGRGGPAWARHVDESGEGSGTGATHSEGGARWSRNPGATTQVMLAQRGGGRHQQVGRLGGWGPDAEIERKGERVTGGPGFLNLTQI
jgi:hypothetical protein